MAVLYPPLLNKPARRSGEEEAPQAEDERRESLQAQGNPKRKFTRGSLEGIADPKGNREPDTHRQLVKRYQPATYGGWCDFRLIERNNLGQLASTEAGQNAAGD